MYRWPPSEKVAEYKTESDSFFHNWKSGQATTRFFLIKKNVNINGEAEDIVPEVKDFMCDIPVCTCAF